MKIKGFDANILADKIIKKYKGIRQSAEYTALQDRIIEHTMACDNEEQRDWMKYYMAEAINMDKKAYYTIQNGNSRAQAKFEAALQFITAYDLIK